MVPYVASEYQLDINKGNVLRMVTSLISIASKECISILVFNMTVGAIRSDQYRAPKTGDILKYHSYDDLK